MEQLIILRSLQHKTHQTLNMTKLTYYLNYSKFKKLFNSKVFKLLKCLIGLLVSYRHI